MLAASSRAGRFAVAVAAVAVVTGFALRADDSWIESYRAPTARIIAEATATKDAWNRLAELTDSYPARLSGSESLQRAIDWVADRMKKDGLDNVRLERVMVPHWVRGAESAEIVEPFPQAIAMTALGGSVGTPPEGVRAEAIVVKDFEELEAKGAAAVRGKIVVYNFVYRTDIDPQVAYRQGTAYRGAGASRAAKLGAVGAFVRSVGPTAHRTPHTGGMRYTPDAPEIPVAGISGEDADKLQRMQDRRQKIVIKMMLGARTLPDVESANVVTELRGREKPDEIVLIGGHLDSWDLAAGAMDDGGGVVATWEAVRLLKKLNLIPRRTIRMVAFVNEENGNRGGQGYRDKYAGELAKHVLALESDNGMLPLKGWGFNGTPRAQAVIQQIATLLKAAGGDVITDHFDGADIQPSIRAGGIPGLSPEVDMHRYFVIHHTPADTVDKIDPVEMARCVGAIAAMAYVVADMPETLERSQPSAGTGRGNQMQ